MALRKYICEISWSWWIWVKLPWYYMYLHKETFQIIYKNSDNAWILIFRNHLWVFLSVNKFKKTIITACCIKVHIVCSFKQITIFLCVYPKHPFTGTSLLEWFKKNTDADYTYHEREMLWHSTTLVAGITKTSIVNVHQWC
jgi:hypothetical protein